jgi:hypothetical protein
MALFFNKKNKVAAKLWRRLRKETPGSSPLKLKILERKISPLYSSPNHFSLQFQGKGKR